MTKNLNFVFGTVENNVRKGETVGYQLLFNSLPNDNIVDWSKLKAFADGNIDATENLKFEFGTVANIVRKGENACYQHFLLFLQCFQKALFSRSITVLIM